MCISCGFCLEWLKPDSFPHLSLSDVLVSPAAAGKTLFHSVGNLGSFVGPNAIGAINKQTGCLRGGLVLAGVSLLASALLIHLLRKRRSQQSLSEAAIVQSNPAGAAHGRDRMPAGNSHL